jgi:hypothetical protein
MGTNEAKVKECLSFNSLNGLELGFTIVTDAFNKIALVKSMAPATK